MKSDEIDILIDRWLDETIEEPEMERLNEWIKENPENADRFAQRSHLHSRLFNWAETRDSKVVNLQQESMEVDTSPVLYLPSYIFAVQLTYSSICDNPLMRAINLQQP